MTNKLEVLLEVEDLKKYFPINPGVFGKPKDFVKAVDGVSFKLYTGETLGLVGESGCGKSTIGRCVLRLLEPTNGKVLFDGKNILELNTKQMRKTRKDMQIIFQDPTSSLNPRMTISSIVGEAFSIHNIGKRRERRQKVINLLAEVGMGEDALNRYPHEFSGGQKQRVGIARALSVEPKLIIADEPVSSLDVSIQAQIINLMKELQQKRGLSYLFISHDLNVIEHICDKVIVMYLGKIVEFADKKALYHIPKHPYTESLLNATPIVDIDIKREKHLLEGDVPSPVNPPSGCRFHTRCPYVKEKCSKEEPKLEGVENRLVACHYPIN